MRDKQPLTYRELQQAVLSLSPAQLPLVVTYFDFLAYIPICDLCEVKTMPEGDRDEMDFEDDQPILLSASKTHPYTFMTYKKLLTLLAGLSDEQLDMSATFYNVDQMESYAIYDTVLLSETKALISSDMPETEDHPLLLSHDVVR